MVSGLNNLQKIEWLKKEIDHHLEAMKAGKEYENVDLEDLVMRMMAKLEELNPPDLGISIGEEVKVDERLNG